MIRSLSVILFSLLCALSVHSQIKVTGAFAQDSVEIGHELDFTLSIETESGYEIVAVPRLFLDSVYSALQTYKVNPNDTAGATPPQLADYEIIHTGDWSDANDDNIFGPDELVWTTSSVGSKTLHEHSFRFKFWDPGQNVIALPPVLYQDASGTQDQYYDGGQVVIKVTPPAAVQGISPDSLQAAPIKPIITEAKNITDFYIYFYIIGGLLLGALVYWLTKRYNNRPTESVVVETAPEVIIPAHEKALSALSELRSKQLWQKGEVKAYQSELTFIIRDYLEDRYDVPALESTTDEIIRNLKDANLDITQVGSLKRILQVADLVKFAKATPDESIHDSFMSEAESFVQQTKEEKTMTDE